MSDKNNAEETPLFLVGIGASAGGLEAIRELVKSIDDKVAAAYIVVQHMSPQHKSLLTTLIGRETHLEIEEIVDGSELKKHKIYVTPPNHDVIMEGKRLRLLDPSIKVGAPKPSIDRFFNSLSEEGGEHAVAVVLSGTGSDGSYGVRSVQAAGGITIAQSIETAKYDGMPTASITTGCIDLVLSPEQIGTHLSKILSQPRDFDQFRSEELFEPISSDILQIILARTRVDFRDYKQTTVLRRIERRMNALNIADINEYTQYCRSDPAEVDALFGDLLISVTRFFRDPAEFEALQSGIDALIESTERKNLRVWVAGCATGEEVYSIMICLAEALGGLDQLSKRSIQIFATDIDERALAIAREGWYALSAINDIPDKYVDTYFVRKGDGIQVASRLRELVVFSNHNVCQDPPFLNMDIICCRNVLIYFNAALQNRIFSRFHYSLTNRGFLFLGTAESVSGSVEYFSPAHQTGKLYHKKSAPRPRLQSNYSQFDSNPRPQIRMNQKISRSFEDDPYKMMFETLARSMTGASVMLTSDLRIEQVFGDVTPFIQLTESARLSLSVSMLKPPFAHEARTLVTLALKHNVRRAGRAHPLLDGKDTFVRMEAIPLVGTDGQPPFVVLTFDSWVESATALANERPADLEDERAGIYIEKLEQEVASAREALQQTVEQLETANEELQSLNEELQSTNEELQATNEEMETSNEELQSTNQELVTVNEELLVNSNELSMISDELEAVLENLAAPVLVVDMALQITRANKAALEFFSIQQPVSRRHISQLSLPESFPKLAELCNTCLQMGEAVTDQFSKDGRELVIRSAPFSEDGGRLQGASLIISETSLARV